MNAAALTTRTCVPFVAATRPAARQQRQAALVVRSGGGFGSSASGGSSKTKPKQGGSGKKQPKVVRYLEDTEAAAAAAAGAAAAQASAADDGWVEMPGIDPETSFISKPIKALILATGRAVCLYKADDTIYATDAASTAYQYPLADASILRVKGKPAVEVPLDGSVYDLATGKVLSWCPKNTVVRKVLGGLKDKAEPVDLPVYPVKVQGGKVFVKFVA